MSPEPAITPGSPESFFGRLRRADRAAAERIIAAEERFNDGIVGFDENDSLDLLEGVSPLSSSPAVAPPSGFPEPAAEESPSQSHFATRIIFSSIFFFF